MTRSPGFCAFVFAAFGMASNVAAHPHSSAPRVPHDQNNGGVFGVGAGASYLACKGDCESDPGYGFDLEIGWFLTPRLALLGDVTIHHDDVGEDEEVALVVHTFALKYYVAPRLWIKGGVGIAGLYAITDEDETTVAEGGYAGMAGVGYEIVDTGSSLAIDVSAKFSVSTFAPGDEYESERTYISTLSLLAGFRFR